MSKIKYLREGRGVCKTCGRDYDVLTAHTTGVKHVVGPMLSKHLVWTEKITARGSYPKGFCLGSLGPYDPVPQPERGRAKKRRT